MSNVLPRKKKKSNPYRFTYKNIPVDEDGWASFPQQTPLAYDLVLIKVYDTELKTNKQINGWWTGNRWWGARLRKKHQILKWKRLLYQTIG